MQAALPVYIDLLRLIFIHACCCLVWRAPSLSQARHCTKAPSESHSRLVVWTQPFQQAGVISV